MTRVQIAAIVSLLSSSLAAAQTVTSCGSNPALDAGVGRRQSRTRQKAASASPKARSRVQKARGYLLFTDIPGNVI